MSALPTSLAAIVLILASLSADITLGADPVEQQSPDIVFSAGREGRGYWGVGQRLKKVAEESQINVEVIESVGSLQNLERLDDPENPVNLTLTQADALKRYLQDHPGFGAKMVILESIGLECVFIIAGADSGIESDQDLQEPKGYRIAILAETSGVAVTFEYMSHLVPGLASTKPVYTDTMAAMDKLGSAGAPDAVMLVHRPKLRSPELKLALEQPSRYRLIPVEDRHLVDDLPNGEAVYEFLDVPLIRAGFGTDKSIPTICTKGLLVASNTKLSPTLRKQLKRIVDFQWMRIYPTDG